LSRFENRVETKTKTKTKIMFESKITLDRGYYDQCTAKMAP